MLNLKSAAALAMALGLTACAPPSTPPVASVPMTADRTLEIRNATGRSIWRLFGSQTTALTWRDDRLGSQVLSSGTRITVDFDDGTGDCLFDIKAEFRDGTSLVESDVNICTVSTITFR